MRAADLALVADALRAPTADFVRDSRVRVALLVNGSGQVLAQHGFTRGYQVVNVASLAAAAHASARALANMTRARRWTHMHHAGAGRQLFLAPFETPTEPVILVAVFDEDSSLGLVQLFFERFSRSIAALPELRSARAAADAAGFERELDAGLERFFTRGPSDGS